MISASLKKFSHIIRLPELKPDFSRRPVFKFISRRSGPFDGRVTLTRDRVYIMPTKAGLLFSLLLITLLIGSINYEKSLGFILTFLLAGIGNILLLSTWRNIAGLELRGSDATAVFSGEPACFNVQLINHQLYDRHSIVISQHGEEQDIVDCAASSQRLISFKIKTTQRGKLDAGRFRIHTEFPSGLFVAWTWADLSMTCLVYPEPDNSIELPVFDHNESGEADTNGNGIENFSHLRKYHQGDNINRISWKAAAKTDELFTKQFTGAKPTNHWIDWHEIAAKDIEQRLSRMTALVINAERNQQYYGLRLPEKEIAPDSGNEHYHRCLTALALY
ncbi:MAG: DUF58 domain-containing protein [Gammaproteobacteria bacterium]|nr:DUF58 domain-containing protein [Gammaproteobacteria bacterium]MBT8133886.1 DUF58 domain-containing protein [Gammaproteobacteria bacterium]NNJ49439.1 DUF58 domain-containing protein [Gammaproteobacteria bacterium]